MGKLGRKIKTISMIILCFALCIGNFNFAWTAKAAVDINTMAKKVYTSGSTSMPYRLYVPADYSAENTYPVIVFLHGAGERGNDNDKQLTHMLRTLFSTHDQMEQSIVIAPQCPENKRWVETDWDKGNYNSDAIPEEQLGTVMKILEEVQSQYSTDNDRIYAIGLSMGGFGTWNLLMKHSDVFAAGIPVCGGADVNKATVLKDVPIWTFHGTADWTVPYAGTEAMVKAIQDVGGTKIMFTPYEGVDHYSWDMAAAQPGLISWLFLQKLSNRGNVEVDAPVITAAKYNAKNDRITVTVDTTGSLWTLQTEKLIVAAYDEEGRLINVRTRDITSKVQTISNWSMGKGKKPAMVKVSLWSKTGEMQPVSYTSTFTQVTE